MSALTIDAQLANVIGLIEGPQAAADRSRPLTKAEETQIAAGKLLELQGSALMLRGEAMQRSALAAADPDYAGLAAMAEHDAQQAEAEYAAERAKYARRVQTDDGA